MPVSTVDLLSQEVRSHPGACLVQGQLYLLVEEGTMLKEEMPKDHGAPLEQGILPMLLGQEQLR